MKVRLNEDKEIVARIKEGLKRTGDRQKKYEYQHTLPLSDASMHIKRCVLLIILEKGNLSIGCGSERGRSQWHYKT